MVEAGGPSRAEVPGPRARRMLRSQKEGCCGAGSRALGLSGGEERCHTGDAKAISVLFCKANARGNGNPSMAELSE